MYESWVSKVGFHFIRCWILDGHAVTMEGLENISTEYSPGPHQARGFGSRKAWDTAETATKML